MNCPHCGYSRSKVLLTRDSPDGVYRRRNCLGCFKNFVSLEAAPAGLKIPKAYDGGAGYRAKDPRMKPGQSKFNTDHLKDFI